MTTVCHREALESADVVALDAEWEPYTSKASASLVQIAARNETSTCIILLVSFAGIQTWCFDLILAL